MPPLVSYIVLGVDSVVIVVGLCLLLTVLTMSPRATPMLIVCGRAWRLRATALILVLAGGIGMVVPLLYFPSVAPPEHAAPADSHGSPAQARHASHDYDRGSVGMGGAVAHDQPGPLEPGATPQFPPDEPFNLSGEWTVMNTVLETNYPPYRQLRLSFRLRIQQQGQAFSGAGEKYLEDGHPIPVPARSPIRIQGA